MYKQPSEKNNNNPKKHKMNGNGNTAERQPRLFVMSLRRASAKIANFQTPQPKTIEAF